LVTVWGETATRGGEVREEALDRVGEGEAGFLQQDEAATPVMAWSSRRWRKSRPGHRGGLVGAKMADGFVEDELAVRAMAMTAPGSWLLRTGCGEWR